MLDQEIASTMKATNVKVWSDNMKHNAFNAWKMLVMSLPKGVASFVMVAAGLSISLPLSVLIIGLPLLSLTLVLCRRMMDTEKEYAESWIRGVQQASPISENMKSPENRGGWKSILSVLGQARSYRGILYCLLQLPIGIAAFTAAIVLPVTVFALMLSPLAFEISQRMYSFELFSDPWVMDRLLPNMESYQRSWVAGGIGVLFVLLLPLTLRVMGRFYASWVQEIHGTELQKSAELPANSKDYALLQTEEADDTELSMESGLNETRLLDPKDKAVRDEMMQLLMKI
jgi:hypothetical protein